CNKPTRLVATFVFSFIQNRISMKEIKEYDEDVKWIINNGDSTIFSFILELEYLYSNEQFVSDFSQLKQRYSDENFSLFLYKLWLFKGELIFNEDIKCVLLEGSVYLIKDLIKINYSYWLKDKEFIDTIINFSTDYEYDKISICVDFILEVWKSQETKELDDNLKWLFRYAENETLNEIIKQNKKQWLANEEFIDFIRKTYYFDKENFLFEVCMSSSKIEFNENIKWLFENAKIENIKLILKQKIGYQSDIIEKILLAHYPFNNIDFYKQKASISNWSGSFKQNYVQEQTNNREREFCKLFLTELEANVNILIKKNSIKKETHAATDLANFVFCPASYVINQSFYIDIQEQENIFIGIQEHEKQRLLSLSDSKKFENYKNVISFHIYSQFFNRILNSKCISQGHKDKNSVIYYSKKKKLSGIPDYIFQESSGHFAVEEKYTIKKYEELTDLYLNHKIQALVYLYGLDEFQFNEVFVIYWFVKKNDSGDYYVYNYRLFCLTKTKENEKLIVNVFNDLESVQNRVPYRFTPNQINYKKCIKCNYFPFCEHKKGHNMSVVLPALEDEHISDVNNNNSNISPSAIK
ncbi:MAG: hypothetical protein WCJ61_08795, partial [Paludibacter sp.]